MFPFTLEGDVPLDGSDPQAVLSSTGDFLREARATSVQTAPDGSLVFEVSWNRLPPWYDQLPSIRSGTVAVDGSSLVYKAVLTRGLWLEILFCVLIWLVPLSDALEWQSVLGFLGFSALFVFGDYVVARHRLRRNLSRVVTSAGLAAHRTSAST